MELKQERQFGTHDLFLEIARGNVRGASAVNKFGKNLAVSSAATEDVWTGGGTYYFNVAACPLDIESTASADDISSTGARTMSVSGLDVNFNEQVEEVTLTGTDIVTTTLSYIRAHRMYLTSAGTGETNAGTITATHQGSGSVIAEIAVADGQTNMAIFTIPAERTGFVTNWHTGVLRGGLQTNRAADVALKRRSSTTGVLRDVSTIGLLNDYHKREFSAPVKIGEKTDLKITASVVLNSTGVVGEFDIIVLDNNVFSP